MIKKLKKILKPKSRSDKFWDMLGALEQPVKIQVKIDTCIDYISDGNFNLTNVKIDNINIPNEINVSVKISSKKTIDNNLKKGDIINAIGMFEVNSHWYCKTKPSDKVYNTSKPYKGFKGLYYITYKSIKISFDCRKKIDILKKRILLTEKYTSGDIATNLKQKL